MLSRLKRWFSGNTPANAQNSPPSHAASADCPTLPECLPLPLDAELAVARGAVSEIAARAEVARVLREYRRHLREASNNPASLSASMLVDPFSWANDTPDFYPGYGGGVGGFGVPWMLNNQGRGDVLPVYINEYGLKIIRDWSRRILAFNEFALNAVENEKSYVVGKGMQYTVLPKTTSATGEALGEAEGEGATKLARMAQSVLDEFIARERWSEREQEIVLRDFRDGEAILRFFHVGGGRCAVRFVEPECLTDQTGEMHRQYGVVTDPDDIEDVQAYSIVSQPNQGWVAEDVDAAEVLHIKANTDFDCKRGLPTLFPVRKNLERADKLLRAMSVMATVQAKFAVIRKHKNFSPSSVSAYQQAQGDVNIAQPLSGRNVQLQQFFDGSIIDASDKTEYDFPAAGINAGGLVQVLQAELRAICARLVFPEWMLTVDASNGNFAGQFIAEAPSTRRFERRQSFYARRFGDGEYGRPDAGGGQLVGAMWRVLRIASEHGLLPREALTSLEIQVEGPGLVVRNKAQETSRAKTLSEAGILSDATWSKWEGLDREQELKQGAKKKETPAPGGAPGMGGGGEPPSTPPGSAFGEAIEEEVKKVFGKCIDTDAHKQVPCPASSKDAGKDKGQSKGKKPIPPEPEPNEKAAIAKASHKLVGKEIQRYAEEYNEPRFARVVKGRSLPNGEPVDVITDKGEGVELKTMVDNGNGKITMDKYAQVRKIVWEQEHGKQFHTVVSDDQAVYNAGGDGKHGDDSKRKYYYRRGIAGSARIGSLHECKDEAELLHLMSLPEDKLPDKAKRTDSHLREGKWEPFKDEQGKGFKNSVTGDIARAKK